MFRLEDDLPCIVMIPVKVEYAPLTQIIIISNAIRELSKVGISGPIKDMKKTGMVKITPANKHNGKMLRASLIPLFLPSLETIDAMIKNGMNEPTKILVNAVLVVSSTKIADVISGPNCATRSGCIVLNPVTGGMPTAPNNTGE